MSVDINPFLCIYNDQKMLSTFGKMNKIIFSFYKQNDLPIKRGGLAINQFLIDSRLKNFLLTQLL